jgi:hypothetical protein
MHGSRTLTGCFDLINMFDSVYEIGEGTGAGGGAS